MTVTVTLQSGPGWASYACWTTCAHIAPRRRRCALGRGHVRSQQAAPKPCLTALRCANLPIGRSALRPLGPTHALLWLPSPTRLPAPQDWVANLNWLSTELKRSRAQWKIVVGHHAPYSSGAWGLLGAAGARCRLAAAEQTLPGTCRLFVNNFDGTTLPCSAGRHGNNREVRYPLESLIRKHGVQVRRALGWQGPQVASKDQQRM